MVTNVDSASDPAELQLQLAMPLLDSMDLQHHPLKGWVQGCQDLQEDTRQGLLEVVPCIGRSLKLQHSMSDVLEGRAPVFLSPQGHSGTPTSSPPAPAPRVCPDQKEKTPAAGADGHRTASNVFAASQAPSKAPNSPLVPMSGMVHPVTVLWREYSEGLGGQRSIQQAYEMSEDKSWKKSENEHKFYARRKPIYSAVRELAQIRQCSFIMTAELLDKYREHRMGKASLDALQKTLKSGKVSVRAL